MNEQRLQEIKKRADRATTGPWFCSWSTFEEFAKVNIEGFCITDELNDFDAEFIAHAREDVPALVVEIDRLQNTIALHEVNKRNLDAMIEQKDAEIERLHQEILGWRRSWKRKRKEAKLLANACRKHKEHIAELEKENERLRSVIWRISDRYDISINETEEFLAGEQNAI